MVGGNYSVETVTWDNASPTFQPTSTYTVTVILTANSGFTFTGLVTATINGNPATITNNDGATVTLEYPFPQTTALPPTDITNVTVTGITIPVTGDTPVTTAAGTGDYTVKSISWSPNDNPFAGGVAYTVTVVLEADSGFIFESTDLAIASPSVNAIIDGAQANITGNTGAELTLTFTFPETDLAPITSAAITGITAPVTGGTPVNTASGTGNFSVGAVSWDPNNNPFTANETYTAYVTLTANNGFTFPAGFTATIDGTAATVSGAPGTSVTLSRTFPATAALPTLILTPASVNINDGNLTATVTVGGTAASTVNLDATALPAGITANVAGTTITVTGVQPASDQSAITGTYTVTVTRGGLTQTFNVIVNLSPLPPPLEITTSVLPDGTANMVYPAQTLTYTGDTPITWSVTGGSLPGGLSLDGNTGVITGTPTVAGTFIFTVTAANAGNTATQELTIRVLPGATPPIIVTETLPGGVIGTEYSQTLVASGTAPIIWNHSGSLPPGITRSGGVLSGTPTAAGTFTFTVTASGTGTPHSRTFTIVITNDVQPPQIVSNEATMGSGKQGSGFSYTFEARGTAPFTWTYTGSLPPGISFNDGVISGTPTAAGTHSFTVTAENEAGTHSRTFSLTIHPALVLGPGGVVDGFPGLTFTVVAGRLQVNGTYTGNSTHLVLPSEIGGIPLGNLTNHNFAGNMNLQVVTIPSNVSLHTQTFNGANNIHTIIIGSNVFFDGDGTGGIIGPGGGRHENFRLVYQSYGSQPGTFIRNTTTHIWTRQP